MDLEAKIAKLEAKLRDELDPVKYSALAIRLATLNAAKKDVEDDDEEDDDEEKKAAAAKKAEEKKAEEKKAEEKKAALAGKKSEEEKKAEEKKAEEKKSEEEKKASAALSLIERATGRTGEAAIGAAAALFSRAEEAIRITTELQQSAHKTERAQLLESITRHGNHKGMVSWLATQPLEVVRGFAEQALKGPKAVATETGDLLIPKATKANTIDALPAAIQEMVTAAVNAFPASASAEKKEQFRAELIRRHLADQAKAQNGAGGTY
jgi:hypothetical protein